MQLSSQRIDIKSSEQGESSRRLGASWRSGCGLSLGGPALPWDLSRLSVPPCSGALPASVGTQLLPAGGEVGGHRV